MGKTMYVLLAVLMLCPGLLAARPGDLDLSFGTGGMVIFGPGNGYSVAVQPDGMILAAGGYWNGENADIVVLRYDQSGILDTTFGEGGVVIYTRTKNTHEYPERIVLDPYGRIVVAGYAFDNVGQCDALVLRLDNTGTLDPSFGTGGVFFYNGPADGYDAFYAAALQPDGKIVVAGETYVGESPAGANNDILVIRLNDSGTPDTSFASDGLATYDGPGHGYDYAEAVLLHGDRIVVAGSITSGDAYGTEDTIVLAYTPTGTLDASFGADGTVVADISGAGLSDYATAASLTPDGHILVIGGYAEDEPNGGTNLFLWQLNDSGTPDTSFGKDGIAALEATDNGLLYCPGLVVSPDGRILIAGHLYIPGSGSDIIVARFDAQGNHDVSFGTDGAVILDSAAGGDDYAADAALQLDGEALLVGTLDSQLSLLRLQTSEQGDVSGDGEMNVVDVLLICRMAAGLPVTIGGTTLNPPYPAGFFSRADINADGVLNVFDVVLAARMALQMPITIDGHTYEYPYSDL